jgi:hypothetical protein
MIEPPFPMKEFKEMSKVEAKQYFDWFVSLSEERCEILRSAIEAASGKAPWFDYSRDSLVPLAKWAAPHFGVRPLTPEEREQYTSTAPRWYQESYEEPRELNSGTKTLVLDIGFYFAEVFMKAHPALHWDLWFKKAGPFNRPYIAGFDTPLVPSDPVAAMAWAVYKGDRDPYYLQNKYDVWARCIVG